MFREVNYDAGDAGAADEEAVAFGGAGRRARLAGNLMAMLRTAQADAAAQQDVHRKKQQATRDAGQAKSTLESAEAIRQRIVRRQQVERERAAQLRAALESAECRVWVPADRKIYRLIARRPAERVDAADEMARRRSRHDVRWLYEVQTSDGMTKTVPADDCEMILHTGILDRRQRMISSGDILRDSESRVFFVLWSREKHSWWLRFRDDYSSGQPLSLRHPVLDAVIIGNRYENPTLMHVQSGWGAGGDDDDGGDAFGDENQTGATKRIGNRLLALRALKS